MAKKSTSATTLSGPRIMVQELMHYLFQMASPATPWTLEKNGYQNNPMPTALNPNGRYIWASTYYDLSGYTQAFLTTFPTNIAVQESGSFRIKADNASSSTGCIVLDLISEESINEVAISTLVQNVILKEVSPSFPEGPLEFQQLIYGRYRMFAQDTSTYTITQGNLSIINEQQFGSASPTTCDKLWIYRIIIPLGGFAIDSDDFVIVPAVRYILGATIAQEDDLPFLMRQKRSFELATGS